MKITTTLEEVTLEIDPNAANFWYQYYTKLKVAIALGTTEKFLVEEHESHQKVKTKYRSTYDLTKLLAYVKKEAVMEANAVELKDTGVPQMIIGGSSAGFGGW